VLLKNWNAVEVTAGGIEFEVGFRLCCRNFDICAYRTFSTSPHTPYMKRTLCGVVVYMLCGVKWRPTYVDVYVVIHSIESEVCENNHRLWNKSWNTKCINKYSLWYYWLNVLLNLCIWDTEVLLLMCNVYVQYVEILSVISEGRAEKRKIYVEKWWYMPATCEIKNEINESN